MNRRNEIARTLVAEGVSPYSKKLPALVAARLRAEEDADAELQGEEIAEQAISDARQARKAARRRRDIARVQRRVAQEGAAEAAPPKPRTFASAAGDVLEVHADARAWERG